jgi:perosamine synthetase
VIVPGYTFVAAANMVLSVGATPLYADIDEQTWLLDPDEIGRLVTPRTRAVLPVHLYGNIAAMDTITSQAKAYGLAVLEDAAEAAFSRFDGKCAGTIGNAGTFSLHATKTVTTGEGGLVVTNDAELAQGMRLIRDHGMRQSKRYWHDVVGYNFRLTNLQAAFGCAQLEHLDDIVADRRRIHALYRDALKACAGIRLQHFSQHVDPVLWVIAVLIEDSDSSRQRSRRDKVMAAMLEDGIETRPGFYALSLMPPYDAPDLPRVLAASAGIISLPTFFGLTEQQIGHICDRFRRHIGNAG